MFAVKNQRGPIADASSFEIRTKFRHAFLRFKFLRGVCKAMTYPVKESYS